MIQSTRWFPRFQWRTTLFFTLVFAITLGAVEPLLARKKRIRPTYPVIREIIIYNKNIFDPEIPGEDAWPFRAANFLHFRTREHVVRREMLLKPGEPADKDLLEESERILRRLSFIKEARIRTVPAEGDKVDVIVETHDTWTTQPQLNFDREGEQSSFSAGITEENALGFGKSVSYFYKDDKDGVGHEYAYSDPQLLGSRVKFDTSHEDNSSGNIQHVNVVRPFYSLGTEHAGGATWDRADVRHRVFTDGTQTSEYQRLNHAVDAFAGKLLNHDVDNIHRLSLHYIYLTNRFSGVTGTAPGTLPENRTFTGPEPRWDWIQNRFIKETFIDRAERIEDINLGHELGLSAGYSANALGSSESSVPLMFFDKFGWRGSNTSFYLMSYGMVGRFYTYGASTDRGKLNNTLYFWNGNYYKHLPTEFPFTLIAHAESAYAQRIDLENQLELGGDTGLRAFKTLSFTGNKATLVNVEGRAFYPHEVLHLAYLGGACFVDAGQVQRQGAPYALRDISASIGAGLRLALTRSSAGSVYRFDVAYALGRVNQDKRIVFSISSGPAFKRNANTYAKFPSLPITQN